MNNRLHRNGIVLIVAIVSIALTGCFTTGNRYMTRGTDQYTETTERLIGSWSIAELSGKPASTIGSLTSELQPFFEEIYASGRITFLYETKPGDFESGNYPSVIFTYVVAEDTIALKESVWSDDYPELTIDAMEIIVEGDWYVSQKGDAVRIIVDPDSGGRAFMSVDGTPEAAAQAFAAEQAAAIRASLAAMDAGEDAEMTETVLATVAEETMSETAGMWEVYPPDLDGMFELSVTADRLTLERSTASLVGTR